MREFNVHPSNKFWSIQPINYSIRELLLRLSKGEKGRETKRTKQISAERWKNRRKKK